MAPVKLGIHCIVPDKTKGRFVEAAFRQDAALRLCLIKLRAALREHGYNPRDFDARWDTDWITNRLSVITAPKGQAGQQCIALTAQIRGRRL